MKDGFIKVCASTPELRVADIRYNTEKIKERIKTADEKGVKILCFPELSITSYSAGDLFYDGLFTDRAKEALKEIEGFTSGRKMFVAVGLPLRVNGLIYNVAAGICDGEVLGFAVKTYLPSYTEFYEKRVFSPSLSEVLYVDFFGKSLPMSNKLLFKARDMDGLLIGVEICEDLWAPLSPSLNLALNGGTVILNLSASDELVGKKEYRENLVKIHSAKTVCGYVYADAGWGESTTDLVYAGHNVICENGRILNESSLFGFEDTVGEIDIKSILFERSKLFNYTFDKKECLQVEFEIGLAETSLTRKYDKTPFVPNDYSERSKRAELILDLQSHALAKRFISARAKSLVIGLSGGLDSTLALLAAVRAVKIAGGDLKNIIAVTMPCFGTTDRTRDNSVNLAKALGVTLKKIDIQKAVMRHFKDIGHNPAVKDVTYENCQARERTQVLMDIANQTGGFVVGTGDLSESALGWSTYNGDHMSMYGVNSSIPKTLVRYLVGYEADRSKGKLKKVLYDILDTPVSPELLPPSEGKIAQKTEDIVGPYVLHDFFLYGFIRLGWAPEKTFRLAVYTFGKDFGKKEIFKWLSVFYKRFFSQQFKRSCMPDGVKVGTVSLSPRGDWRMPSDASADIWLEKLEGLKKELNL